MKQALEVDRIRCHYDDNLVVDEVSFAIKPGDICCLLGASGCGKTTILRSIAGFHPLSLGEIRLGNKTLSGDDTFLPPERRHIGMIFQDYALFPHLNVCDNICFGIAKQSSAKRQQICNSLLELVSLTGLGQRFPHELSGGQQQRVALARALAPEPALLLMDEPFSSLDVELRRNLAVEVRHILKERGISAILVTHDQEEAFAFADQIGVVNQGKIEQWDTPYNLYHQPQTRYVANFIGQGAFIPGTLHSASVINTELGDIRAEHSINWVDNTRVEVLLRPDDIVHDQQSPFRAKVINKVFAGTSSLYTLQLPTGSLIQAAFTSHQDYLLGDDIGIRLEADHTITFQLSGQ